MKPNRDAYISTLLILRRAICFAPPKDDLGFEDQLCFSTLASSARKTHKTNSRVLSSLTYLSPPAPRPANSIYEPCPAIPPRRAWGGYVETRKSCCLVAHGGHRRPNEEVSTWPRWPQCESRPSSKSGSTSDRHLWCLADPNFHGEQIPVSSSASLPHNPFIRRSCANELMPLRSS